MGGTADEFADSEPCLHIVDGDRNFCEENMDRIIKRSAKLSAASAIVSIVGAQNSGKSFLMNRLFETKFHEMDATRGWSQTTRGIMMSRCKKDSLLLLDVEGFDGNERGQDKSFENQAALFALVVSDIMIINIHIADTSRNQAGGAQLFRTIFQERTKIEGVGFTKILVVIRNYNGETPQDILRRHVLGSLQKAWESVNVESMKFEDYIEVDVFGMPDKDMPQKFQNKVIELRTLLSKTRSAKIPASKDSWTRLWDIIKENNKLDIPSHEVLMASLNCWRQVEVSFESLDSLEDYKLLKAEESPSRFKEISYALSNKITTRYDLETEMYDHGVRNKERKRIEEKLNMIFKDYSRNLMWKVQEKTLEQFKQEFDGKNIQNMDEANADLYGGERVDRCIERFMSLCEDLKVFDLDHLHKICRELEKHMRSHVAVHIREVRERIAKKQEEERERIATTKQEERERIATIKQAERERIAATKQEEREKKAEKKNMQSYFINGGISLAGAGVHLLTGFDGLSHMVNTVRHLIPGGKDTDQDSPSTSQDQDFDLCLN